MERGVSAPVRARAGSRRRGGRGRGRCTRRASRRRRRRPPRWIPRARSPAGASPPRRPPPPRRRGVDDAGDDDVTPPPRDRVRRRDLAGFPRARACRARVVFSRWRGGGVGARRSLLGGEGCPKPCGAVGGEVGDGAARAAARRGYRLSRASDADGTHARGAVDAQVAVAALRVKAVVHGKREGGAGRGTV